MSLVTVITFYKIFKIEDVYRFSRSIERIAIKEKLLGTFFVTPEGINTTLAGKKENLIIFLDFLTDEHNLNDIKVKWTSTSNVPFKRLKIRIKPKLLPLEGNFDLLKKRGKHVSPEDWNDLIKDPNIILLDVRNIYETKLGSFKGSIDPKIATFIDFPEFIGRLDGLKPKNIAMFCTGGIRCEVASSFMLHKGHNNIFQLEGGILNYLKRVSKKDHLWEGECFVFDERVSVNKNLEPGNYIQCFGCRRPLSQKDIELESYVQGVSCLYCINITSNKDKLRFKERQKQIDLAKERGINHFGNQ